MKTLLHDIVNKISPVFTLTRSSPTLTFFSDQRRNEALDTMQFLTLYQLLRETIKVGNGEMLLTLYKPLVSVFDTYNRTKYR